MVRGSYDIIRWILWKTLTIHIYNGHFDTVGSGDFGPDETPRQFFGYILDLASDVDLL
jgi:hypothetical protein